MSKKILITISVIFTLFSTSAAFAMMGGMGGGNTGGGMHSSQQDQYMTSAQHDQDMNSQSSNHVPQTAQGGMTQAGTQEQSDHVAGGADHNAIDHSSMDHQAMDEMNTEAEAFFME